MIFRDTLVEIFCPMGLGGLGGIQIVPTLRLDIYMCKARVGQAYEHY